MTIKSTTRLSSLAQG